MATDVSDEELFARARDLAGRMLDELAQAPVGTDGECDPSSAALSLSDRASALKNIVDAVRILEDLATSEQ